MRARSATRSIQLQTLHSRKVTSRPLPRVFETLVPHKILLASPTAEHWLPPEECSRLGVSEVAIRDCNELEAALEQDPGFVIALLDESAGDIGRCCALLARHAQACIWIAMAPPAADSGAAALECHGPVFDRLTGHESTEQRRETLQRALAEVQRRQFLSKRWTEHSFARGVLSSFSDILEDLLESHVNGLHALEAFLAELAHCRDGGDLRERVERACQAVCSTGRIEFDLRRGPTLEPRERCAWSLPVESRAGRVGYLLMHSSNSCAEQQAAVPTQRERLMLSAIASATAMAMDHLARSHERDSAQHATILALAKLAEQRDNETGRHLLRVSEYCKLLALGLRARGWHTNVITDEWIDTLVRSAPLHDIGKVGIPDQILLKPARLAPDEWEIMKTHTSIGAKTLEDVMAFGQASNFLGMSRDIALGHHERWDGGGYPRGLAGDEIPLSARILSVADVYDALTSVRPYKAAWPHERARATILEGSGTQFDPRLIEVFSAQGVEMEAVAQRLADHDATTPIAKRIPVADPGTARKQSA